MKIIKKLKFHRNSNPLKFFGNVCLFFIIIGLLVGLWLVFLFLTTGKVEHIPLTILTALFITVGIQILVFGFLADMWRQK